MVVICDECIFADKYIERRCKKCNWRKFKRKLEEGIFFP
jgi:hypothetical protein